MTVSYATNIRPLFTQTDIDHMAFFCDLAAYADVKTNAHDILGRLKGIGGRRMPPPRTITALLGERFGGSPSACPSRRLPTPG